MKKIFVLMLLSVFMFGCASTPCQVKVSAMDVAVKNTKHVTQLTLGMTKEQVEAVMGTESIKIKCWLREVEIKNPTKTEVFGGNGKSFEVLYYLTNTEYAGWEIVEYDDLTPLVFLDNKLIGVGELFLREVKKQYNLVS
jgi:hypothetical protein